MDRDHIVDPRSYPRGSVYHHPKLWVEKEERKRERERERREVEYQEESKIMQGRTSEPSKSQARCKDFPDGWLGLGEGTGKHSVLGWRAGKKKK